MDARGSAIALALREESRRQGFDQLTHTVHSWLSTTTTTTTSLLSEQKVGWLWKIGSHMPT